MANPPPLPPRNGPSTLGTVAVDVPFELVPDVQRLIADARRPRPWFDVPLGIGLGLFAVVLTYLMTVMIPRFEELFRDFGVKLPTATILLLRASRFFGPTGGWMIFWIPAIVVPIAVARARPWPPRHRGLGLTVTVVVTLLLIGLTVLAVYVALQLPMLKLIQAVSGGPSRP